MNRLFSNELLWDVYVRWRNLTLLQYELNLLSIHVVRDAVCIGISYYDVFCTASSAPQFIPDRQGQVHLAL